MRDIVEQQSSEILLANNAALFTEHEPANILPDIAIVLESCSTKENKSVGRQTNTISHKEKSKATRQARHIAI